MKFIRIGTLTTMTITISGLKGFTNLPNNTEMPVLFIGHGSPMNAIEHNEFTKNWNALGKDVQRVKDAIDHQLPDKLINYKSMSSAAQLAVPSTEHYLP